MKMQMKNRSAVLELLRACNRRTDEAVFIGAPLRFPMRLKYQSRYHSLCSSQYSKMLTSHVEVNRTTASTNLIYHFCKMTNFESIVTEGAFAVDVCSSMQYKLLQNIQFYVDKEQLDEVVFR
jgi:hypothetical protein